MAGAAALIDPLEPELKRQREACGPSVVAIQTFFAASENGEFQKSTRTGAGVFVDRALIVTSAHVVGLVSAVRDSEGHANCYFGRTFALTMANKLLKTKVLAVNFAGDVAVLEAVAERAGDLPPHLGVSSSAPSMEVLLPPFTVITRHRHCDGGGTTQVKMSQRGDNTQRSGWPYQLEDGLGWVRYGGERVYAVNVVPGSPWFNFSWQVIGLASWPMGREPAGAVGGFVVPPQRIKSAIEYAKTKDPRDPVVVNSWVNAAAPPTFADTEPLPQGCFLNVPHGYVSTINLPFNFPACVPPGLFN